MAFIEVINRVIRKAVEEATSVNGVSIIITFEHHPLTILHPERFPKRVIQEEVMDTVLEDFKCRLYFAITYD